MSDELYAAPVVNYITFAAQPAEWHDKQADLIEGFLTAPAFTAIAYAQESLAYHREQAAAVRAADEYAAHLAGTLGVRWEPGL